MDLLFRLTPPEGHGHLAALAERNSSDSPRPTAADSSLTPWSRLTAVAEWWGDPQSPGRQSVVWVEFDLDDAGRRLPVPGVFFAVQAGPGGNPGRVRALIRSALATLGGGPNPEDRTLARCLDALPSGTWVPWVARMLSRPGGAARLVVQGLDIPGVSRFLRATGSAGAGGEVADALRSAPDSPSFALDLDVFAGHVAAAGMECYPAPPGLLRADERWSEFLAWLVGLGVCTEGQREALLRFPGRSGEPDIPERWPPSLGETYRLLEVRDVGWLRRNLNHVKLKAGPAGLEAKAYLALNHEWNWSRLIRNDAP
jgi:hypothetical protein